MPARFSTPNSSGRHVVKIGDQNRRYQAIGWLDKTYGIKNIRVKVLDERSVVFEDPQIAMMFKLMWG